MMADSAHPIAVVIDDDPDAAEALAIVLRDLGADVVAGSSATAILAQTCERTPLITWIVSDFDLGDETGIESASALRRYAPGARVLILSGNIVGAAAKAAAAAGFDTMEKPATAAAIAAWLDLASLR